MNTNLETQTASQSVDEVLNYTETVMLKNIQDTVKAQVDKDIKPLSDELSAGKTAMRNLLTSKGVTYKDTDSIAELAAKLSAACLTIGGCELAEGCEWTVDDIFKYNVNYWKVVKSNTATSFIAGVFNDAQNLIAVILPNYIGNYIIDGDNRTFYAKIVSTPSVSGSFMNVLRYTGWRTLTANNLMHFEGCSSMPDPGNSANIVASKLYDMKPYCKQLITVDANYCKWNPTTALLTTSQSLTPRDEWDTHPSTVTFLNNLEKFLWYFEHRFMPSFATIPSTAEKPTLTLSTAVYNAISASTAVAHNADGSTMYATADYSDFGTYDEAAGRTTAVTLLKALEMKQNWNVAYSN